MAVPGLIGATEPNKTATAPRSAGPEALRLLGCTAVAAVTTAAAVAATRDRLRPPPGEAASRDPDMACLPLAKASADAARPRVPLPRSPSRPRRDAVPSDLIRGVRACVWTRADNADSLAV
ncbi:hypothetical protein GCM10009416_38450 [Craurococcus roseus]|uniref:Uncharacterized protein n=1 Tax=Craurococcus roseus TaxID=77585 RepID=A0ABN1FRN9_9PROT